MRKEGGAAMEAGNRVLVSMMLVITCVSCDGSTSEGSPYCFAVTSSQKDALIQVKELYLFGGREHGTVAVDRQCPAQVMKVLSYDKYSRISDQEAKNRVRQFHEKSYFTPSLKSGIFKIDGLVYFDKERDQVQVLDVLNYGEVERSEGDHLMSLISKASRN